MIDRKPSGENAGVWGGFQIRVSDLVHYLLCPRIVFYARRGLKYEPKTDPARAARKAVVVAIAGGRVRPIPEAGKEAREAEAGAPRGGLIPPRPPEEWSQTVERVKSTFGPDAVAALEGWSREALAGLAPAREVQVLLASERLGLRGEVDKIVVRNGEEVVALVRAAEPPPSGAWRSDRVALAAYGMLLEEARGKPASRGLVEYVGLLPPAVREVRITGYDRNMVRALLERVRKMGPRRPWKPWKAPCGSCNFYGLCFPKGRRLF